MDIRHLRYVAEVARLGSFTNAAEVLHITQPTISKTVKQLEEELGVEVFVRDGKAIELTDAGQAIVAQAQHILKSFENLTMELEDLTGLKKGRIRIGLPPMAGSNFFPSVIGMFREQYPGVVIELVEDGSKTIEVKVENGTLDMGVVLLPVDEATFDSFSFVHEHLKLLVHPSHRLASQPQAALSELEGESFILFREDFSLHDRVIEECVSHGFRPQVLYKSSQWDFISEMVAANLGIGLLPETICGMLDKERVRAIPMTNPVIPWQLGMIWRKDGYLSFAAREWIRFTQGILAHA